MKMVRFLIGSVLLGLFDRVCIIFFTIVCLIVSLLVLCVYCTINFVEFFRKNKIKFRPKIEIIDSPTYLKQWY